MNEHAAELRVCDLATHFREIGDTQMRDLPFYNANLEVEAWGFSSFDDDSLMGVLITPWFMNLLVLPLRFEPVQAEKFRELMKGVNKTWAEGLDGRGKRGSDALKEFDALVATIPTK